MHNSNNTGLFIISQDKDKGVLDRDPFGHVTQSGLIIFGQGLANLRTSLKWQRIAFCIISSLQRHEQEHVDHGPGPRGAYPDHSQEGNSFTRHFYRQRFAAAAPGLDNNKVVCVNSLLWQAYTQKNGLQRLAPPFPSFSAKASLSL